MNKEGTREQVFGVQEYLTEQQEDIFRTAKGDILKEFEKLCPTEMSFKRVKKDVHNVFDALEHKINGVKAKG